MKNEKNVKHKYIEVIISCDENGNTENILVPVDGPKGEIPENVIINNGKGNDGE